MFDHILLGLIFVGLGLIFNLGVKMAATLDTLLAEVTRQTTVNQSAITLLASIAQQLKDAGTDPVKLQAIQDQLTANDDAIAAAVTANTPAAPTQS